ncbi:hypothetical protein [Akkermansia sp.]|uniref:hypothetical protein n=1 Tax=Akkermansia sp. TaxID=1872421 RepID=UPI003AF68A3E
MKDVISSAGMRAGAYGERKTKSMPVAQEQLVEKMILRVFGLELFLVAFYKDA